jgi:hypothetical protein
MDNPKGAAPTPANRNPEGTTGAAAGRRQKKISGSMEKKAFRLIVLPLLVLIILGAGGYFIGRPVYAHFRMKKGLQAASIAAAHFATNNYIEGIKSLEIARKFALGRPEVVQLEADVLTQLKYPNAVAAWYHLSTLRPLTQAETWKFVDIALDLERLDVADGELKKLAGIHGREAAYLKRHARLSILRSAWIDAINDARAITELEGSSPASEMLLAEASIRCGDPTFQAEGKRMLLLIAQTDPKRQVEAINLLYETGQLDRPEQNMLARLLNAREDLNLSGQLLAASLRMTVDKEQRQNLAEEIRSRLPANNEKDTVRFVDWCLLYRIPRPAIEALRPYAASTNDNLVSLQVQALALDERWAELDELLGTPDKPFVPAVVQSIQAWRSAKEGRMDEAKAKFKVAISSAAPTENTPPRYAFVANWAEMAGLPLVAVEAYTPMLQDPMTTVAAAKACVRLLRPMSELEPSFPVAVGLLNYAPGEDNVRESFTHMALVLNREIPKALTLATELHQQKPDNAFRTLLLAAALTRSGKAQEGLNLVDSLSNENGFDDRMRTMKLYVLLENQQREPARRVARQIDRTKISREELAMIPAGL